MTLFRTKPWEFVGRRMERNAPRGYRCDETCTHKPPTPNTKICLCPVCHELFSTPRNFDRHRDAGWCLAPDSIGLRLNENGVWILRASPGQVGRFGGSFGDDDEDE